MSRLCITIKDHCTAPLSNPIVRGIEMISFVHVDGDLTYLQRSQDVLKLEKMSETLSKLNGQLKSKLSIIPGDVNLFESHGKFYRCVVKSVNSKTAVVHCIDFGFEKQVEKKKLQYLGHSKIALLPALVITVKTFPMAFNMSKTMFLANMHVDDDGTLNAIPNKIMNSIHSKNKLIETLKNGCLVKVTSVYTNNECWIVPELCFGTLETISNILVKMQSKIIPDVTEIGSLCAALHVKTKKWHRALILNVDDENENTLSIDTGERFKAIKTTKLTSEIQKIPNCALRCQVISNIDVKKLLNKEISCRLISCDQPLKIELFSNDKDIEITSTQSVKEWLVAICRFESFNEFYVRKLENSSNNFVQHPSVGTLVTTLTDKGDDIWYAAEVLTYSDNGDIIVRTNDGSICKAIDIKVNLDNSSDDKLYYRCCLEEEIEDININDHTNFDIILELMMTTNWTMRTSSDKEPYKVTLTSNNVDCINILHNILTNNDHNISENCDLLIKNDQTIEIAEPKDYKKLTMMGSLEENTENGKFSFENDLILPDIETVTIKYIKTFQNFYVESESLSLLYLQKINSELDLCIIELPLDNSMIGNIVVTFSIKLKTWCRTKIQNILSNNDGAYCYLLDFGTYEECFKFYKPTNFLSVCPPIVRRCSLYAPELIGKENEIWYPNIDDMFKDISSIEGIKFDMIIKENNDPYVVTLQLEDDDVRHMLYPLHVQLSYVNSLVDFKVITISSEQKKVCDFLKSNFPMVLEENPIIGNLYLAYVKFKPKRVQFDALGGIKYVVIDIDDTLDLLSVDSLYKIPTSICNMPIFVMSCSLILEKQENMYSLDMFQKLANSNITFTMCIITETDNRNPNLVKLYFSNKDVLDIITI